MEASSSSCSEFSDSSSVSSGFEIELEEHSLQSQQLGALDIVQPWRFEPQGPVVDEDINIDGQDEQAFVEPLALDDLLNNTDWCSCGFCQIMDRRVESICCQDILQIKRLNEEVFQEGAVNEEPSCIALHPGFRAVCLNTYVLKVSWLQYRQQYGNAAYEGPEHKQNRHIAYRQLVRWGWGVLGKEIRVVLPSCAVSCIRAHFPPPGLEENFHFTGFLYADE